MTHSDYLAVFDWNSTLLNDIEATIHASNACLAFFDIPPLGFEKYRDIFTFPLIHFYEKAGVSVDNYLEHAEELGRLFQEKYISLKTDCQLMEGTTPLLKWLCAHNVTCKILSNYSQKELEEDVHHFGIEGYFDTISGNPNLSTLISGTNKYERLRDFIEGNGYNTDKTFIVGDSHEEPQLARKLDILGISITGGLLSPARLEKHKKDYVIDSLTELPAILAKEWGLKEPKTMLA